MFLKKQFCLIKTILNNEGSSGVQAPEYPRGNPFTNTGPTLVPAEKPFLIWAFLGMIVLFLHIVQFAMKTTNYFKVENKNNT